MSNTYLTTNADVNAAYQAQAGGDKAMDADAFAQWHYQNYGQNEQRGGWSGGDRAGGAGLLSQAGAAPQGADYRTQIQADLSRLEGAGSDADLRAYLASTKFTPEQLAEVSGYNASDIASRMGQLQGTGGAKGYLQENPQVAKDYYGYGYSDKGYTLDEYAKQDWQKSGAKPGFGFSADEQGYLQSAAPETRMYQSKMGDDQLQSIAQFYMREMSNTNEGMGKVNQAMQQYGVSPDDLAYAVSKYGDQYKTYDDQQVPQAYMVKNMFGAGSKDQALFKEPTEAERKAMDIRRAVNGAGKYSGSRSSVPGEFMAEAATSSNSPYYTQNEMDMANGVGGSWNYQRADGSYVDLMKDPNWQQTIQDKVASEKASWQERIQQSEGKVSPFAAGGTAVGAKNAPGKGVNELAPGLAVRGVRSTAPVPQGSSQSGQTSATAARPGGVQSQAVAAAKEQALQPTAVTRTQIPSSVNQNDFGVNQKYAAEIKSDRASQALYSAYTQDLARIDANAALSPQQKAAAKEQAAQKADRLLSYRKGA